MSGERHVVGRGGDALHHRELVVVPALVKAQQEEGSAAGKMLVGAGNCLKPVLGRLIADDDEVPHLVIAGARRFQSVGDDGVDQRRRNGGREEVADRVAGGESGEDGLGVGGGGDGGRVDPVIHGAKSSQALGAGMKR